VVRHNALTLWVSNTGAMIIIIALQYFASSTFKGSFDRINRELEEKRRVEIDLRESEEHLRTILDSVNDAITIHDLKTGEILYVNNRMCELTGYTRDEAIRVNVAMLSSGEHPYTAKEALKWLVKAAEGTPQIIEWHAKDKNGRLFWVEVNMRKALIRGEGRLIRAARDITERKQMEDKLKDSERRLRLITNNMMDLITVVNMNGTVEYISPSHKQILGYESEEYIKKWGIDLIHPDDREKILQTIRETFTEKKHQVAESRILHADGHYVWLETVVDQLLDEEQKLAGVVFSSRDITERKKAEKALLNSEEKYRQILENIDDGYYEVDLDGHFTFFNDVLPRFLGYAHEELSRENFKITMDEQNVKKVFKVFHGVYLTGVPARLVEFEIKRKDGSKAYVESSVSLIRDTEGEPIGFRGVVRDIAERKQFQDMLHAMAITDQLTGLYNRRGFITLAEQQLKYADRTKRKVLLSFIDLDDMKNINDIWGHEEGDRALVNTAKILKQAFRESDIIARIGGDEFAVLASDAIDAMQDVLINRLHQQIDIHNTQKDLIYMLALSIGSTFYEPDNPRSLDELMSKADKLMYEDKRRKGV
jgi:diguanylate cyclase (GGDEF)-like protein/PAS domain S-box-containing protein